jgi:hypothetical protein
MLSGGTVKIGLAVPSVRQAMDIVWPITARPCGLFGVRSHGGPWERGIHSRLSNEAPQCLVTEGHMRFDIWSRGVVYSLSAVTDFVMVAV